MVLDLRTQDGREVIYRLVEKSDVFLHNLRSQAAQRLGLDYETLSRINPRLVYSQASGWGRKGPDSDKGAFDAAAAARTGLMYVLGEPEMEPPQRTPGGICDMAGAMCLAMGTLAALQAREWLGRGQMVSTSLFGSAITLATWPINFALTYGYDIPIRSRSLIRNPLINFYKCADGEWVYLMMLQFERYWPIFCEAMDVKELEKDPRFETLRVMADHCGEAISILDGIFTTKTRAEWMSIFAERDLIFAPIQRPVDLVNDPQALANDYITEFDHPIYGREKVLGLPYEFSETPASIKQPCPELGQHTEEILLELDYTGDDIARLKEGQII